MRLNCKNGSFWCTLLCVLFLAGFAGAAPAPIPVNPEATAPAPIPANPDAFAQFTVEAGEHWRDMAVEVAARVYKTYEDRPDLLEYPLYLALPNNRPFSVAFYNLLRSELISRGLQLSYDKEGQSVLLEYAAQTVPFASSRFDGMRLRGNAKASNNEIIVNVRMFYRNRFVMHYSGIRYINDEDLALYVDPQNADPLAESIRNIRIIKK